jgi:chorismate synthase
MSSIYGSLFRISTWGESHGGGVGVVIDGCPPGVALAREDIQQELDRRRPGQSEIVTPRDEKDQCEILSGIFEGETLGTPISVMVRNKDARPEAYREMAEAYRPSHADYTYEAKYGRRNWQGGGRASARETIGRVAGGAVARRVISQLQASYEVVAYVRSIRDIDAPVESDQLSKSVVEANIVRAGDTGAVDAMVELVKQMRSEGNSVGGVVECVVRNCPVGLGSPVFGKLDALLAGAMLSLPATKGFEIGSGFGGTLLTGCEHNDPFHMEEGRVRTTTNRSGGVQGGISNGENLVFRVAFKPTATIMSSQKTVTVENQAAELKGRGRHDPCVLPRAVPIVEAMTHLVVCDQLLLQRGQCGTIGDGRSAN